MKVELIKWSLKEKDILKEMCNSIDRKYLSDRIPSPYKEEDALWWLNYAIESDEKSGIFRAIVVDGKICGNISVEKKNGIYSKEGLLGYFLLNEYWGKGITTTATEKICSLAFEKLDIIKICASTFEENLPSRRVLEKNGFKLEGIREKSIFKNGKIFNECMYGKIK